VSTAPSPLGEARAGVHWDRCAQVAFVALVLLGADLRVWLCFHDDGIYWPDEIYQSLEPAHRLVFGYGLIPWEFIDGARNWAFPALVAALLKVASLVAFDHPRGYLAIVRLAFSALGMATAWGTWRLARSYGSGQMGAALGAVLFSLAAPAIYFAPRALSETASAAAVLFGLAWALRPNASARENVLGASLVGLSVLLRIQNGIFCVGLLGTLLARRRWRQSATCALVLVIWAAIYGAIDRLTWGDWFHAAITYLRFTLIEGKSSQWGTSGPTYYLRVLWTSMPLVASLALPLALAAARRATGLFATALAYLLLHSLVAHKEYRFMLPFLPVWFALAGIGYDVVASSLSRAAGKWLAAGVAGCAAVAATQFHRLTFGDLGQYENDRPQVSAYDDFGPLNRLLLSAHDQKDLCGLMIEAAHLAWTGGATYLHRNVPIYSRGSWREAAHFNYVIAFGPLPNAGRVVASEAGLVLVRLPRDSCVADPQYPWRLP
jgi:GPI mannosyltransferase 3